MTLYESAIDHLYDKFKNELRLLQLGNQVVEAERLYKLFAARFAGQPYALLQTKTEIEFTEAMIATTVEEEQYIQDRLYDYSVGLQVFLDQTLEDGYATLIADLKHSVNRYMSSPNIPIEIRDRINTDLLDNPVIFLNYLMYSVVRRYNMEEAALDESTPKSARRS